MKTFPTKGIIALAACSSENTLATGRSSDSRGRGTSPFLESQVQVNATRLRAENLVTEISRGGASGSYDKGKDEFKKSSKKKKGRSKRSMHKDVDPKRTDSSSSSASAPASQNHIDTNEDSPGGGQDSQKSDELPQERLDIVEEILKHDNFYHILGVSTTASGVEIKKAYRRRAVQTHPDKTGGDRRAFDKVAEAYEALSDDATRGIYDRFGKDGVQESTGASSPSMYQDLFRNMFQQRAQSRARKNRTVRYQLQVSLEDLYNGVTHDVDIGSPYARGKQKTVQVHIPPGSLSGQRIVLSGEMDFAADDIPGDVIFVLSQKPHPVFTRKGNDLAMELSISLEEALCGFQRQIRHLNGSDIWVASACNADKRVVIQTGDVQILSGHGMPKRGLDGEHGDIYIQFRVEMPKPKSKYPLSDEEVVELSRLLLKLSGSPRKSSLDEVDTHRLKVASISDFGRASSPTSTDEDSHLGGPDADDLQFFSSGFFNNAGPKQNSFYFGSSTFGTGGFGDEDGSNIECQQM